MNTFSNILVPLFPGKKAMGNSSRGYLLRGSTWHFYIEKASSIKITLGGPSPKGNFISKAVVTDAQGQVLFSRIPKLYEIPDKTLHQIELDLKPGIYQLVIAADGRKGYFPIFTPAVKNVYEQSDQKSSFNQYFTPGYFYVPKGVKILNIRNSLFLTLKAPSWQKPKIYKAGIFSIPVGDNSGKVWEVKHVTRSNFTLLNIPPYVANSKENLLVPQELIH